MLRCVLEQLASGACLYDTITSQGRGCCGGGDRAWPHLSLQQAGRWQLAETSGETVVGGCRSGRWREAEKSWSTIEDKGGT